jgi:histidinol-phosphate phosphatase family protein
MNSNRKAAVFLDRDGTIIEDRGHLRDPSDVIFFPETFSALRKLQDCFLLFIVTNQVGVAKGILTLGDVNRINRCVVDTLAEKNIVLTDVYTCPHSRADKCSCIKPKPFFLHKASARYGIDLHASFTIGDHPHDVQLAQNAGARGIYVLSGHGEKHRTDVSEGAQVVSGIQQATEKIMSTLRVEM